MVDPQHITGLILAGGRASRMQPVGGQSQGSQSTVDKGLVIVQGRALVAWVHGFLVRQVGAVWVSANRSHAAYDRYGRVVADDPVYGQAAGPLAGVATALRQLQTPWLLTLPVDTPVLPADLVDRLVTQAMAGPRLVSAVTDSGAYPLCMLVHRDLFASLHAYLLSGQRKVKAWQALAGGAEVHFDTRQPEFFNINTPGHLQTLQAILDQDSQCAKS